MIRRLTGTIAEILDGSIILDVQGVGYYISTTTLPTTEKINTPLTLHTYLAVRETALDLYGFFTRDELEIFELLLTLPKIGPKSAMQILGQADVELLKKAVLTSDASYLSKMSGIGKKTAEKIVNELHDKFAKRFDVSTTFSQSVSSETNDVIDALIALGYTQSDARKAVQELPTEITDVNQAIKEALRKID